MIRKRIFEIIEPTQGDDKLSYVFDIAILTLIFLNVLSAIISTIPSIDANYGKFFSIFEVVSVVIFTVEYLSRMWVCVESDKFAKPFFGRIKYFFTPMALIDALAILPFYLTALGVDLRMLRVLRLFRLLRVLKAGRYFKAIGTIQNVFRLRKEELVMSMALIVMILILSSSVMYYVEGDIQPEAFSSIPASMWWAVATLTTVGYGDVYPVTSLGRIMGAVIAISGVGLFALPAGLIATGFMEEIQENKSKSKSTYCKHCGKNIDE